MRLLVYGMLFGDGGCVRVGEFEVERKTFKMKSKQITDILKKDNWAVAEGTHEDKPLVIRFRQELRSVSDFRGHHLLLQITWPYESPDESGLPGGADGEAMERFEERILAAYEHDAHAVLAAVITTNGARQWILYTSDIDTCGQRLAEMPQESEPYPVELTADEDPDWRFLRENILAGCDENAA